MASRGSLDERNLDMLKELATIGVGHATGALSALVSHRKVGMRVPHVSLIPVQDLPGELGGAEDMTVATWVRVKGEMGHVLLFMLPEESALALAREVLPDGMEGDDELVRSALLEIGNIVAHSYLNAVSVMVGAPLAPEPPRMAVDMGAAIIGSVLGEEMITDDFVAMMSTAIQVDDILASGSILILPDGDGLGRLLALGGAE